ncbi:hypothetical protein BFR88_02980 [Acinetobacter pittii]|nr:hypothetical protein BFR86_16740 [Acinetobacter pittii]OCY82151.1 hypothetical protein BFR88_02980 [Acinetobacter pittii]OCY83542.1 hypothetical protein BFR87_02765 [Acinetobacter pittii]
MGYKLITISNIFKKTNAIQYILTYFQNQEIFSLKISKHYFPLNIKFLKTNFILNYYSNGYSPKFIKKMLLSTLSFLNSI